MNLLPHKKLQIGFAPLGQAELTQFVCRLGTVVKLASAANDRRHLADNENALASTLEEIETEPTMATVGELLDRIERARIESIGSADHRGYEPGNPIKKSASDLPDGLVCYSPARSLATGEANLASRGYFDAMDRPPIGYWLQAITRRSRSQPVHAEIAILAWIPQGERDSAEAGVAACRSGSLALLSETSPELAQQVQAFLNGYIEA